MSLWNQKIEDLQATINSLTRYTARFLTAKNFADYIEDIAKKFEKYPEIMLMGYFDNAFTDIMEEKYPRFSERCKIRVISHGFIRNDPENPNRRSLEALADLGVMVKVNVDTHARMFIGYNPETGKRVHPSRFSELILGSFDFNRDGLSRRKTNAGIITRNEDIINEAVALFERIWKLRRSVPLEDYLK